MIRLLGSLNMSQWIIENVIVEYQISSYLSTRRLSPMEQQGPLVKPKRKVCRHAVTYNYDFQYLLAAVRDADLQ